jgi:membrane-associated phospholipid phosphatase
MPSTHAAFVTFFVTYYAPVLSAPLRALATLYAAIVIYSRYAKKCHSVIQLASGSVLGGGLGVLATVLFSNMQRGGASMIVLKKPLMWKDI